MDDNLIIPNISYPEHLPVSKEVAAIKELVAKHQLLIICGETGSGKTTQLPKILLDMGYAKHGIIGHTQPRRVAAISIAKRIGEELQQPNLVGYKIRFTDKATAHSKIKLMTDGILLQEMRHDKLLSQYSALIIDEAHERSLNIDFILGYIKKILAKRPDLRIIITSATIHNEKFAQFFNQAPVLNVAGKTYPVDIIYQPYIEDDDDDATDVNNAIYKAIEALFAIERGNVLVFMPGEREIKQAINFLNKTNLKHCMLLPLYARQNESAQNLVFENNGTLKIIVTTNIAETSLTIPGIKYVIDTGVARIKRYNVRTRVEQLQIEKISQASCKQRAGRAGRISHGMCVRLYSESDYKSRAEFTTPEILRSNLSNVILQLISLRLGNPREFAFMDMPEAKAYNDGFKILYQLGALDEHERITPIGKYLTHIPIDVSLARMLYAGVAEYNLAYPILVIVSFLAIIDPREYPAEQQQKAREVQQLWQHVDSDFITILNLWLWYNQQLAAKLSKAKLQQTLHAHFLNAKRMREWQELFLQLKQVVSNIKLPDKEQQVAIDDKLELLENSQAYLVPLHQALLTGLINNIGQKDLVENYYLGTQGKKFVLAKTSGVNQAPWLVAASLVLTSQLFARMAARIEPQWLIPLTRHLVKYTYADYHFDAKRGEVVANQATLLYGLVLTKVKVPLAKIDMKLAHEIFIEQGIVAVQIEQLAQLTDNDTLCLTTKLNRHAPRRANDITHYAFMQHNLQVMTQLIDWEQKHRTSFIIWESELAKFYASIIPQHICDMRSFIQWCDTHNDLLKIDYQQWLSKYIDNSESVILYPNYLLSNQVKVPLKYVFNQIAIDDGINAYVAIEQLNLVDEADFVWLVPGMIRDKVAYMIKSLPKTIRIGLNPLNATVTEFLEQANMQNDFNTELSLYINRRLNSNLTVLELSKITLPRHLMVHFIVMDKHEIVCKSDSLLQAREMLEEKLSHIVSKVAISNEITPVVKWIPQLSRLLEETQIVVDRRTLTGYNTLILKDGVLSYITTNSYEQAVTETRKGMFYLVKLQLAAQVKFIHSKQFNNFQQTAVYLSSAYANKQDLLQQSIDFILRMSADFTILPKSEHEFNQLVLHTKTQLSESTVLFATTIYQSASYYQQILRRIKQHPLHESISLQLDDLIFSNFLRFVSYKHLQHFPRYLQAIIYRLDKYTHNPHKDKLIAAEIEQVYHKWYNLIEELEQHKQQVSKELYDFKYKIEELRVSLFAQELKTQYPVSVKRLNKELEQFLQVD